MEGNAISVKIGAETDGIEQGLKSIQQSLGRLENSSKQSGDMFDASFGKIAGATAVGQLAVKAFTGVVDAAFAGVRNTVAEFGNALDLGGRLSDLSSRTGETAGNLLLLERAFDNSGVGAEKVGQSVNKLQKFMEDASAGGKNQADVMNALGLSLADLAGKAPTEQMQIFASRIAGIEDPGKRAALAMEIFGKSGGELLPLLSNFSGELETARGQLGSMTDIMDRRAAVFDSVSDKIAIISRKFTDFAAGILDRAIPALDAITEGLSRIDAAAIGQKLADAFLGGTGAMAGFQAAVDAFSTGNISGALSILWDSIVLQAQMSANSILKNLSAAFATAGDILAQIFRSDGPAMMLLRQSFTMIGGFITEKLYTALSDFMSSIGRLQMAEVFKYKAETAAREVSTALESIPTVAGLVAEDAGAKLGTAPELFKQNLAAAGDLFPGLQEKADALAVSQEAITAAAKGTTEQYGAQNESLTTLIAQQQQRDEQEALAIKNAADIAEAKFTQVERQIALNEAIATGNTAEQQRIQKLIDGEAAQARINKLTEEYAKAMPIEEAQRLAEQMVASEQAVANTKKTTTEVGTEIKTVGQLIAEMNGQEMDAPAKSFKEQLIESRSKLGDLKSFIGEDLSNMSLSSIVEKLGLDVSSLSSSSEQLAAVRQAVAKLEQADPADITPSVDQAGVNDKLEAVKNYLDGLESNPADATPKIDEQKFGQSAKSARGLLNQEFQKNSVEVALKADKSIGDIRQQLGKQIDLALTSSEGSKILSDVKNLVSGIKDLVAKIEPKLPQRALA